MLRDSVCDQSDEPKTAYQVQTHWKTATQKRITSTCTKLYSNGIDDRGWTYTNDRKDSTNNKTLNYKGDKNGGQTCNLHTPTS